MSNENTIDTTRIHEILKSYMTKDEKSEGAQVSKVAKQALGIEDPRVLEIKINLKNAIKVQLSELESNSSKEQLSKNSLISMFYELEAKLEEELKEESSKVRKHVARFVHGLLIDISCEPQGAW